MVARVIGFDCDHMARWSRLDTVKRIKFHLRFGQQRCIKFSEKDRNMWREDSEQEKSK